MVFTVNETDFFIKLAELPSEVTTLIVGFLPKCMLPELLYFPPIKEIVISTIFSNVSITYQTERHRGNDGAEAGYWECDCHEFCFTLVDLLEGIKKWNIYPRSIHIHNMDGFQNEPDTFVELLILLIRQAKHWRYLLEKKLRLIWTI